MSCDRPSGTPSQSLLSQLLALVSERKNCESGSVTGMAKMTTSHLSINIDLSPGDMVATTMTTSTLVRQSCTHTSANRQIRNSCLPCTAPVRSLSCKATFRGGNALQHSRTQQRTFQQRQHSSLVVQAGLGDVGKYLSEAATAVFSPTKDDVPWSGGEFQAAGSDIKYAENTHAVHSDAPALSQVISLARCLTMKEMCHA